MANYDEVGREIPNKTPVAIPVGYHRPEPLESMIARMIRAAGVNAGREGKETFEEADDFDVDDDEKLVSPYQFNEMQEENLAIGKRDARTGAERDKTTRGPVEPTPEKKPSEEQEKPVKTVKKVAAQPVEVEDAQ